RRRAASPIPHRFRIERQTGLASARGPYAQQGPRRSRPPRIHRRAISPDIVLGGQVMRNFLVALPIVALAVGSTACASKKFVRTSVGEVNDKVEATNRSLEETQERTRRNEGRISEVDQKAGQAATAAQQANAAAQQAHSAANDAATTASAVGARADAIDKASKR